MNILFFTADWCTACHATKDLIRKAGYSYSEVNVSDGPDQEAYAIAKGVAGFPTLIFRNDELQEVARHVGAISVSGLREIMK